MASLATEIAADSPLAHWNIGYTGDVSGNLRHLKVGTAPTPLQAQLLPGAATFSTKYVASSSTYLYRAHAAWMNVADSFTIEFIYLWTGGGTQYVITKGVGSYAVRLVPGSGTIVTVELVKHGTGVVASGTPPTLGGSWGVRHVVITKSGSTRRIYIDGVDVTVNGTNRAMTNTTSQLEVGRNPASGGTAYANGYLSDLAVYNYPLSATRALDHFWATRGAINAAATLDVVSSMAGTIVRQQRPGSTFSPVVNLAATPVRRQSSGADPIDVRADLTADTIRQQRPGATFDGTIDVQVVDYLRRREVAATTSIVGSLTVQTAGTFVGAIVVPITVDLQAGRALATLPTEPPLQAPELVLSAEVSPRFRATISHAHRLALLIEVLDGATGTVLTELDTVTAGSVTLDAGAAIRGRVELEVADDGLRDLVPTDPQAMLAPYGNELRVSRGVRYPDGTAELVTLGVFRIRQSEVRDTGSGLTVRLTGLDRWSRIVDARFESTYTVANNTNRVQAITDTVEQAWPDVPVDLDPTPEQTPQIVAERGDDRGEFIRELALAVGSELYFNGNGTLVRRPIAQATDPYRWELAEGENALLLEAVRSWDVERVYNRVVASGESMDDTPPVTAIATDENPDSPTYYYGPFGARPRFYVSGMLQTVGQARAAAEGILAKAIGTSQRIELSSIVNPALEPGDVVRVRRDRLGLDERHVIDAVEIPLAADGVMTASTRLMEIDGE